MFHLAMHTLCYSWLAVISASTQDLPTGIGAFPAEALSSTTS